MLKCRQQTLHNSLFIRYDNIQKHGNMDICPYIGGDKNDTTILLLQIGVGKKFFNIINEMYKSRVSWVKVNIHITNFFRVRQGVKQGIT